MKQKRKSPWGEVYGQTLLGAEGWVKEMRVRIDAQRGGARRDELLEMPAIKKLRPRATVEEVIGEVARRTGVAEAALRTRGKGESAWWRSVAMWVAWQVCGRTQRELGEAFGVTYYAVSKAIDRVERGIREERRRARGAREIMAYFQT